MVSVDMWADEPVRYQYARVQLLRHSALDLIELSKEAARSAEQRQPQLFGSEVASRVSLHPRQPLSYKSPPAG